MFMKMEKDEGPQEKDEDVTQYLSVNASVDNGTLPILPKSIRNEKQKAVVLQHLS